MLSKQLLLGLLLRSCLGLERSGAGGRRMIDTRRIHNNSNLSRNKIPHTPILSSRRGSIRNKNSKRKTRQSKIRGSTTFSRLLNIDPSMGSYSDTRYPRQASHLTTRQKIITNITEKLELLELACMIQPCSSQLEMLIMQAKRRKY